MYMLLCVLIRELKTLKLIATLILGPRPDSYWGRVPQQQGEEGESLRDRRFRHLMLQAPSPVPRARPRPGCGAGTLPARRRGPRAARTGQRRPPRSRPASRTQSEIRMQKSRKKLPGAAPASQGDRSACPEHSQSTGKRKKLAVNKHSGVPCKRVPLLAFAAACALPAAKIHGCAHRHSSQVLELLPLTAYFGGARYERRCC